MQALSRLSDTATSEETQKTGHPFGWSVCACNWMFYLRYAIFNATKYVCIWDPTFKAYLARKRAEGKHYNVAISHAAKKLVRLIYAMQRSGRPYLSA